MDKTAKKWNTALFIAYGAVMLWLLFVRERGPQLPFWEHFGTHVNLVPLHTIRSFLRLLTTGRESLVRIAAVNLAGNVVLFVPLGFLLPQVLPGMGKFWRTLLLSAGMICMVEILQLLFRVGSCDIDDLILNLLGASLGYGIFAIGRRGG